MAEGILLSGATGFLGTNVLEQLIHHTDSEIYVLIRSQSMEHAIHRLKGLWYDSKDLYHEIGKRILPILSDIQDDLEIEPEILEKIRTVIHAAAQINPQVNKKEMFTVNLKKKASALKSYEDI